MEIVLTEDEKIIVARREYQREWRKKNAKRLREYHKEWRANNKIRVAAINRTHWLKRAQEMGVVKS